MKNRMISELLKDAYSQLLLTCGDKVLADQEAWWLLQHVTGKSRSELMLDKYAQIPCEQADKFALLLDQRVVQNKPLSYILGCVPFYDLNILIEPPVLIPRPETEEWVCWLISVLKIAGKKNFSALDLCCGSGCIGLAIAKAFPEARVLGIDISEYAIKLSKLNKIENHLNNIEFMQSDMFENLPESFSCDLVFSNPPYLSADEYAGLDADVRLWEDKNALVADDAGMKFYETILLNAPQYLSNDLFEVPSVVLEIGPAQGFIETFLQDLNYENFEIYKDMQGRRRWLAAFVKK